MGKAGRIAIITEGLTQEPRYFDSLKATFFPSEEIDVLCLPTEGSIYALWKRLRDDEFQTDLIEVVRECGSTAAVKLEGKRRDDFQEIYLFYDLDPQQRDLRITYDPDMGTVLRSMMKTFNNETELGKLYISYPMVEALRDVKEWSCEPHYRCVVSLQDLETHAYKEYSSQKNPCTCSINPYTHVSRYTRETWDMILAIFLIRCGCLFGSNLSPNQLYTWYKENISPAEILEKELSFYDKGKEVFVLSAFPEWLLDYFRSDHWSLLTENLTRVNQPSCKSEGPSGST